MGATWPTHRYQPQLTSHGTWPLLLWETNASQQFEGHVVCRAPSKPTTYHYIHIFMNVYIYSAIPWYNSQRAHILIQIKVLQAYAYIYAQIM